MGDKLSAGIMRDALLKVMSWDVPRNGGSQGQKAAIRDIAKQALIDAQMWPPKSSPSGGR